MNIRYIINIPYMPVYRIIIYNENTVINDYIAVIIIIIIVGLSLLQSIPPTTATIQTLKLKLSSIVV